MPVRLFQFSGAPWFPDGGAGSSPRKPPCPGDLPISYSSPGGSLTRLRSLSRSPGWPEPSARRAPPLGPQRVLAPLGADGAPSPAPSPGPRAPGALGDSALAPGPARDPETLAAASPLAGGAAGRGIAAESLACGSRSRSRAGAGARAGAEREREPGGGAPGPIRAAPRAAPGAAATARARRRPCPRPCRSHFACSFAWMGSWGRWTGSRWRGSLSCG